LRAKALPRGPTSCCWSSNESLIPSSSRPNSKPRFRVVPHDRVNV
jgi:hypothetical protein